MEAEPALQQLCAATLFIEQPIKRQVALARSIAPLARFRPVIIDESDGELDAFVRARALGYGGVSSKNCKGLLQVDPQRSPAAGSGTREDGGARLLPVGRGPDDAGRPVGAAGPRPGRRCSGWPTSSATATTSSTASPAGRSSESLSFLEAHPDLYHEADRRVCA
mgnify:CR=1 FL=1